MNDFDNDFWLRLLAYVYLTAIIGGVFMSIAFPMAHQEWTNPDFGTLLFCIGSAIIAVIMLVSLRKPK